MFPNLKALIVVLAIALAVFELAKPMCLEFMQADAFRRRRNVWLALTVVAFASPTFWIYALFASALLYWAAKRDDNPLALFVLVTFTIPNIKFFLPGLIVNQLFDLTQYRILSLFVLLPVVARIWKEQYDWGDRRLRSGDILLLAFLALQIVALIPYESATNTMRRSFLLFLDSFLVFYAFSRLSGKDRLAEVMVCFFLCCAVMAPIAVFESARGWLLYTGLASLWGDPNDFAWIGRGDLLRAQAAGGHSIGLGYLLAVAMGLYMYIRSRVAKRWLDGLAVLTLAAALFVTGSRGAWLTAAIAVVLYALLRPGAARNLAGAVTIGVVVVTLMYFTPLKEAVLDRLPIIGTADQDTVNYRQQLAEVSWHIIKQNPLFGDPFVYLQMDSLRQGQGIIDIVNGYIYTALYSGLVGLVLQLGVFAVALGPALKTCRMTRANEPDSAFMGAALIACVVATLFFVATAGWGTTAIVLAGLLLSYAASCSRVESAYAASTGDRHSRQAATVDFAP